MATSRGKTAAKKTAAKKPATKTAAKRPVAPSPKRVVASAKIAAPLEEALAAWRRTRHPRWADRVTQVARVELAQELPRPLVGAGRTKADDEAWAALERAGDPLDLGRLFAALRSASAATATERLAVLARREDPRLVEEIIALLEDPPWRANLFKPFVTAALERVIAWHDVRALAVFEELAPRYKGIIETSVGDWVSTKLVRACEALRALPAARLDAADAALLDAAGPPSPSPKKAASTRSDAELLAMVYAAPEADDPRLVYADALSERGAPRGEFIVLQIERARGRGSEAQLAREIELHDADAKRRATWALPLANGGNCRFARGFPVRVALNPTTAKKIVGDPAWATVHEAADLERLSGKVGLELLDHPAAAGLRSITRLPEWGAKLAPKERAFEQVVMRYLPSAAQLALWPKLERLELEVATTAPKLPVGLLASAPRLRELVFESQATVEAESLASAPQLTSLSVRLSPLAPDALLPLRALRTLCISLERETPTPRLDHETLRELELCGHDVSEKRVLALLEALPKLELLRLDDPSDWATCEKLLALAERFPALTFHADELYARYRVRGATVEIFGFDDMLEATLKRALTAKKIREVRLCPTRHGDPLYDSLIDDEELARARAFFDRFGVPVERGE